MYVRSYFYVVSYHRRTILTRFNYNNSQSTQDMHSLHTAHINGHNTLAITISNNRMQVIATVITSSMLLGRQN